MFKITVNYKWHPGDHVGLPDNSKEYDGLETIYAAGPITDTEIKRMILLSKDYVVLGSINYEVEEIRNCNGQQGIDEAKIPVDECPAGPEMDAAMAKVLAGHSFDGTGKIENRDSIISEFCKICGKPKGYHGYDNYRRIENAWRLIEILRSSDKHISITLPIGQGYEVWVREAMSLGLSDGLRTVVDTLPLAICRAFLKANGVEFIEMLK
jgi:hypothetical protein